MKKKTRYIFVLDCNAESLFICMYASNCGCRRTVNCGVASYAIFYSIDLFVVDRPIRILSYRTMALKSTFFFLQQTKNGATGNEFTKYIKRFTKQQWSRRLRSQRCFPPSVAHCFCVAPFLFHSNSMLAMQQRQCFVLLRQKKIVNDIDVVSISFFLYFAGKRNCVLSLIGIAQFYLVCIWLMDYHNLYTDQKFPNRCK